MKERNQLYYVPTKGTVCWKELLADPEKQWKPEYSAYELAECWEGAKTFPRKVHRVLKTDNKLKYIELLIGIPEHQVPLKGGARPSQNDIWLLARSSYGLVSMAVDGKVHETFGELLGDWDKGTTGRSTRLKYLCDLLRLSTPPSPEIRYQLLHRTASAIIEAQRFNADHAIMMVHSFATDRKKDSFQDYCNFLNLFGLTGQRNQVVSSDLPVGIDHDISLRFVWVDGK